ncbi:MAG: LiaF domain-containing protein [Bacteroidota bacterium]
MDTPNQNPDINNPQKKGRVWGGLFLLFVGFVFFVKEADFFFFPNWLFSWPMILIGVGVYTGLKHNFRGAGWLIPVIIGGIFLVDRMDIGLDLHRFIFPIIVIGIGLVMILRPKHNGVNGWDNWGGPGRYRRNRDYTNPTYTNTTSPVQPVQPILPGVTGTNPQGQNQNYYYGEDYFDITSVLGSTHRVVTSKNFKGGDITCFMGGAEIDLSQADINGSVVIDITTVMGGAKLIVPTNWEVKPEITNVLGGVEDKRQIQGKIIDFNKVLILKGTAFMGGIELRSF